MNFEKRVVIHRSGVPTSDKYCLVLLNDGTMNRAHYSEKYGWVSAEEGFLTKREVKSWCYIEDLFESHKNVDIRMYIDESESCI